MLLFLLESWLPADPSERDRADFATWREADDFSRELAAEGYDSIIFEVISSRMAEPVDMAEHNGVRPGMDFPATLAGAV